MNQIIARTNSGEYAGGSTIYGAVYLRLLEPVVADTIAISFIGEEVCSWSKVVPNRGDGMSRSRSVSQNSTDTGFHDDQEANATDLTFREIVFSGKLTHIKCDINLKQFSNGVIPLGCYAIPFQLTLKQGLPNSFKKEKSTDEVKRSTFNAQVNYEVTAMLKNSKSRSESDIKCTNKIVLRNEDFMKRANTKVTASARQQIKICYCFNKGEMSLVVTLDKKLFTLGETMHVNLQIENKTDVKISTARIKLLKTINFKGKRRDDEGKAFERNEAFCEEDLCKVPIEMGTSKSKSFDVPIVLKHNENEIVATTFGSVVKCRCHLEVELDVPLDNDISVIIPIEIYPNSIDGWETWTPPEWIKDVQVIDAEGMCAVPRHTLVSTEYHKVPLPLAGL